MIERTAILFKKYLPSFLYKGTKFAYKFAYRIRNKKRIRLVQRNHQRALENVRKKEKIKVVFFLIHEAIWKYEALYKLFEHDERYDPLVVVCPIITFGEENMLREMNQAFNTFTYKGYKVLKSLDENTGEWLDVKKKIKPDIIFFTNPHKLTKNEYYIENFLDVLTCYVPYAFVVIHSIEMHYNQFFQFALWKHFVETDFQRNYALHYFPLKKNNICKTGYPSLDRVFQNNYIPKSVWKNLENPEKVKKIIWAPHHTISGQGADLDYSSFKFLSDFFLNILKKNENIQVAFKPHPLLKPKLYRDKDWGEGRTNKYYDAWNTIPNGQLEEGDYVDLFFSSDALILDSASFMVEYLYTQKPLLFTILDTGIRDRFNSFGKLVFDHLYHSENQNEIEKFIENVVIAGNDFKVQDRLKILENLILPDNGQTASMNIYMEIKNALKRNYE